MRDATTGRSRGFGFLTFKDPKTVNTVMVKEHYLDGKIVSTWRHMAVLASFSTKSMCTDTGNRLIPSAPSLATSRKRQARSSSAVSARRRLIMSSRSTLLSLAASWTPPS